MSLQNPSYSVIELTKRILEIEALSDHTLYCYIGNDYLDEKEEHKNTYLVSKIGSDIVINEFTGPGKVRETQVMNMEDFAQFANNNKLGHAVFMEKERSQN